LRNVAVAYQHNSWKVTSRDGSELNVKSLLWRVVISLEVELETDMDHGSFREQSRRHDTFILVINSLSLHMIRCSGKKADWSIIMSINVKCKRVSYTRGIQKRRAKLQICRPQMMSLSSSETVPEHVGIDTLVNFAIHFDDIDISLGRIPNNSPIEDSSIGVLRNVDAERAVHLQLEPGNPKKSAKEPLSKPNHTK